MTRLRMVGAVVVGACWLAAATVLPPDDGASFTGLALGSLVVLGLICAPLVRRWMAEDDPPHTTSCGEDCPAHQHVVVVDSPVDGQANGWWRA